MFKITLLGQFNVEIDNTPMTLPSRSAQSVFAYLCLHSGRVLRREKIAGIFWPDTTERASRGYLRHSLWRIRNALNDRGLDSSALLHEDRLHICCTLGSACHVDVQELLQPVSPALTTDQLATQLCAYAEFLPGFNNTWDEWTDDWRVRIEQAYILKGLSLLNRLSHAQRWDELLYWAGRLLTADYDPAMPMTIGSVVHLALQTFMDDWKLQIPPESGSEAHLFHPVYSDIRSDSSMARASAIR